MTTCNKARAERVGDLLRRYLWARSRCLGGRTPAGGLSQLASQIEWGLCEFDGVRIEPKLDPPIGSDRHYPGFFSAIIERDDAAMPELKDLAPWRDYVYLHGPMPKDFRL